MDIRWEQVPDDTFEEITAALLRAMGLQNVVVRTGGGDDGWDVDAEHPRSDPDGRQQAERWKVECKRYRGAVPAEKVRDHFHRMVETDPAPDVVLFVTSGSLSNPVKDDLERAARRARVRVRWWERDELTRHVLAHLASAPLRRLVAPWVDLTVPFPLLRQAAARQVRGEIERRVGKKYLPHLYRGRPIEADLAGFLAADADALLRDELVYLTVEFGGSGGEWTALLRRMDGCASAREAAAVLRAGAAALSSEKDARLLGEEVDRRLALVRNCFLIKDRAGSGKTNLLCRMALEPPVPSLSVFLSCRFDLREHPSLDAYLLASLRTALEPLVSSAERMALPRDAADFLQLLVVALEREGEQLVVFLDGINESRDLVALNEAIVSLLQRWNGLPVKFVVTCRDIFWDFFDEWEWERFLYRNRVFSLPAFTDDEVDGLIDSYFHTFGIRGRLLGRARDRCRHPLLLRFFCQAYEGQDIRAYEDLRLKELFDVYWARKRQEIGESLGLGPHAGARTEGFMFQLVGHMVERSALQVSVGDVARITGEQDLDTPDSLYRRLLDQDIILEELPPEQAMDRSYAARKVAFVYDEFYDYIAALSHVHRHGWNALPPAAVAADFVEMLRGAGRFEQLVGVAEYLVLIAEPAGLHRLLCAVLARLAEADLLCSVLPKLRDVDDWAPEMLRVCLESATDDVPWLRGNRHQSVIALLQAPHASALESSVLRAPLPFVPEPVPEPGMRPWHEQVQAELMEDVKRALRERAAQTPAPLFTGHGQGKTIELTDSFHEMLVTARSERFLLWLKDDWLHPPTAGDKRVVDTVWTLWANDVDRVWQILMDWTHGGDSLVRTARQIVAAGFGNGGLEASGALAMVERLLTSGSREHAEAATRLMPAFPSDELLRAYDQWAASGVDSASNALPAVMRHLFHVQPVRTLAMLHRWALADARHDLAIAAGLAAVDVPPGGGEQLYGTLEKMLLVLIARVARRCSEAGRELKRLLTQVRVERSRLGNQRSRVKAPVRTRANRRGP
jgi:hypothetical protein